MRRSKKSLGSAILVSILSASMTFSIPAYALTIDTDKTVNEAVTNGLKVNSEVTATINGNVSDKTEDGGKIVEISHGSKVTINGDVNTNIENSQGDLTVSGNVSAKVDDVYDPHYYGAKATNGSTTIGKDVKVETKTEGYGVYVQAVPKDETTGGNANVSVGGDISINSSGNTYVDEENNEDDEAPDEINFCNPVGLRVDGKGNGTATVKVSGKIEASSKGVATGISVGAMDFPTSLKDTGSVKIDISSGSVSASGDKETDKSQVGKLNDSESNGIFIVNGKDVNSEVNIMVDGDLTSEIGIAIYNRNDKTTKAVNNIAVDGTIKSTDGAVEICNFKENSNTLNLTTWKIESGTDQNVIVKKYDKEADKEVLDKEATEKQSANINYIIRHEGTISLEGTRSTIVNGTTFETAHEKEKLTIHVKVDDDKKYRVDRVEGGTATATKNADGSWTLTVPKNGGVDIRAVLVAIEQKENQSSSGSSSGGSSSGGGSSSSRPGVSNAASGMTTTTTDGATVQTNVTKDSNLTTTAAAVRIGTTTANVTSSVSEQNGTKVTFQNASGNLAGASFKTVGQVSADGTTLVKEDGTTAKMATGMLLAIENADGTSVGCFVDATGKTIATGAFEVYYMLGTDGKLHAHFVNPQGYFMTGIQVINGQTVTFNAVGEMVSVL